MRGILHAYAAQDASLMYSGRYIYQQTSHQKRSKSRPSCIQVPFVRLIYT